MAAKEAKADMSRIRVRALADGYYGHVRQREGSVFTLIPIINGGKVIATAKDQFSEKWMEVVPLKTRERVIGAQEAVNQKTQEIMRSRVEGRDDDGGEGGGEEDETEGAGQSSGDQEVI